MTNFSDCIKILVFLAVSVLFIGNVFYVSLHPKTMFWFTPIISFGFMVLLCPRVSRDPSDYRRPQQADISQYGAISNLKNDRPPSYSSIVVEAEVLDKFPQPDETSIEVLSESKYQDMSEDGLPTFEEAILKI
ncbi:uncharacterized protein [Palaemon carinicauda]|uniref:uncharacterized protein n=1 Tax=Palaemon carinicauda TaxID=392227 RepID=UPI0035B694E0